MDKNADFAKKRRDLVDKSPPSISRISSPKTGHPICDHLELVFSRKYHKKWAKMMNFVYFVITNFSK